MRQLTSICSLLFLVASLSSAQHDNWELVRAKTTSAIQEAVAEVKGAAGIVAIDLANGEQFAVNENIIFPQGSAIKIPILMEVYKQVQSRKIEVGRRLAVTAKYQVGGSGVLRTLGDGTSELSVRDLCVLMITLSDNTATNMLIDLVGMENINATMKGLGLKETKVQRRMIDLEASKRGEENISTPAEAARIMSILYKREFVDAATSDAILEILKMPKPGAFNSEIPAGIPVAFKPGGIAGVSTEWAIVYDANRPYVIVAMENYSVGDEASTMMKKTSKVMYEYFSRLGRASKYGTYVR